VAVLTCGLFASFGARDPSSGRLLGSVDTIGPINQVIPSPDGRSLATLEETDGSTDLTVRLWNLATGQPTVNLGLFRQTPQLVFDQDGSTLTAVEPYEGPLRRWRTPDGAHIDTPQDPTVSIMSIDPTVHTLAVIDSDGQVGLRAIDSGNTIAILDYVERLENVAFSLDGRTVATAGWNGRLRIWNVPS
jgi:WD40 repeat protein